MDRRTMFYKKGAPKLVRCYDNGGQSADRFTVVFTGRYRKKTGGDFMYLGLSANPYHPMGFGQHGFSSIQIDRPSYVQIATLLPSSRQ